MWGMDVIEGTQRVVAEAGESFQDLVAEAMVERNVAKAKTETTVPHVPHEVAIK